ncbi:MULTISPECIES: sensor histidine kinase [unclassified Pseudonocardia]|uniref:sensor histidine kinase n=1 Tax=unclassified Pseudonocardia TaxID=2619320 RepID=UPI0011AE1D35|nr:MULTISPECIES: ATP-binding protein [unclassified Pseudonocardia]
MALVALVVVVVGTSMSVGLLMFARDDAYRTAERVAEQVGVALIGPLSGQRFAEPLSENRRVEVDQAIAPYLTNGMIRRVKVWTVDPDGSGDAAIAYSDKSVLEGERGQPLPEEVVEQVDRGMLVTLPVPDDDEHRFESGQSAVLLEVFAGFRDASDRAARLEVYVPVDTAGTVRETATIVLPAALGSLVLLGAATIPLSARLARRIERENAERRALRRYGLTAAESARHVLARRLHHDIIPDLASAGLLVDAARTGPDSTAQAHDLLSNAHQLLVSEIGELRAILSDVAPPESPSLTDVLARVVEHARAGHADAPVATVHDETTSEPGPQFVAVIGEIAGELARNAVRHANASHLWLHVSEPTEGQLLLKVRDNGMGFDAREVRPFHGHIGLRLVADVARDNGGQVDIDSTAGRGTMITLTLPVPR